MNDTFSSLPQSLSPLILLLCCICLAKRLNIHERHFSRNIPNGRFSSVIGRNPRWGNAINAAKPPFFRVQCMHTHFRGRRRRKKGLLSSQHLVDEHACQPASQPGQSRQGGKAVKSSAAHLFPVIFIGATTICSHSWKNRPLRMLRYVLLLLCPRIMKGRRK